MRRAPAVPLEVVVGVVGLATLGAEIAAARLMAPYFGASTIIWANTIGIVLVALSIGYWLGGRRADRDPTAEGLYKIVLLGAVLVGIVPFVSGPFLDIAVEALDSISAGAFAGSLIGVLVLIATPVLVLGMVAPYAIRLAIDTVEEAGRVSGRLYAISTVGSLAGTFTSALFLIPLRRDAPDVSRLRHRARNRRRRRASPARAGSLVPVALIALMAVPVGIVKADAGAGKVISRRRHRVPVRPCRRAPRRRALARAQRGPGRPLDEEARHRADGQHLGRVPRRPVRGRSTGRPSASRSSATPPARPRARTGSCSRTR